jgi:hypothetical protein
LANKQNGKTKILQNTQVKTRAVYPIAVLYLFSYFVSKKPLQPAAIMSLIS